MKAVWVNTREEWEAHKAAGHRTEISAKSNGDTLDMPPYPSPQSGGWVDSGNSYIEYMVNTRAFVPDDWNGFGKTDADCGEGFNIEGIASLAAHYGVDITLTTKLGTIHIKSNTKFAND